MPVTISSRVAQRAYGHFQALHAAVDSGDMAAVTTALDAAHAFATKHFKASGGVFLAPGDSEAATSASESGATVIALSIGGGDK